MRITAYTLCGIAGFLLLAPGFIDIVYYRFTLKRTTFDVFNFVETIGPEMQGLVSQFFSDFWYLFLFFIGFMYLYIILIKHFLIKMLVKQQTSPYRYQWWPALIISALIIVGGRGSFHIRPLNILHATQIAGPQYAPIVLNSTFTIIKTYGKKDLVEKEYFSDKEAIAIFNPVHCYYDQTVVARDKNVVVFIVESLSAEHMGVLNGGLTSFTPFLDSLSQHGLLFSQMYANGQKSLEGIPAVVSSIPALTQNPFITSMYASNRIEGLGSMLKRQGYQTAFFHGGLNGTMNFDGYSASAGYERYYGKNEYTGSPADFDGRWGIFDEPWLQFTAQTISNMQQPFHVCVFTLSSHHPYTIPEQHQGRFKKGELPIHETIAYADYSIKRFFQTVSKQSWFQNTLFVITADHTSEQYSECFRYFPENHAIPMIWYCPSDSSLLGNNTEIVQQTDILPSLAHYLNLPDSFVAFGNSVFDKGAERFALIQTGEIHQLLTSNGMLTELDDDTYFNQSAFSSCRNTLLTESTLQSTRSERLLKALVQQFYNRAIHNRLAW